MTLLTCNLPNIKKLRSGKVREVFDLCNCILFVTTDRISAFDSVFPNGIPGKGKILNQCSAFWFEYFKSGSLVELAAVNAESQASNTQERSVYGDTRAESTGATQQCTPVVELSMRPEIPNHLITTDLEKYPTELQPYLEILEGRSMIVKKTTPLPVECVVRGYLAGSGWKEYQEYGTLAAIKLPKGLRNAEALPEPMFTPSTKAEEGHDIPITWEQCCELIGQEQAEQVRAMSLQLYTEGARYARERGIIIADTKFEFGLLDGKIILIDECMTPDSSRFWPIDEYEIGKNPPSFDKQFLRDYLESCDWNKQPPAPELPPEIIAKTASKYQEAFERLTGKKSSEE